MSHPTDDPGNARPLACDEAPEHFSSLLDADAIAAALSDDAERDAEAAAVTAIRQHLERCPPCRGQYERFVASTRLVRSFEARPAPDLVASILDAVDAAEAEDAAAATSSRPAPAGRRPRLRRVASHLIATSIGAAAAVLLMSRLGVGTAPIDPPRAPAANLTATAPVLEPPAALGTATARATGVRLRFADGVGAIWRDGQLEQVAGTVTFYPGEDIEVVPREPEVIERIVPEVAVVEQRAPWTVLPPLESVDVDEYAIALSSSIQRVRRSFDRVAKTWDDVAAPALSGAFRDSLAAAGDLDPHAAGGPEHPATPATLVSQRGGAGGDSRVAAAPNGSPASAFGGAPTPFPAVAAALPGTASSAPAAREVPLSPVEVTWSGTGIRIATRGPLLEVVPRLIALLKGQDRELVRLAEEHLRLIRTNLERDPELAKAFATSDEALERRGGADASWVRRLLPRSEAPPAPASAHQVWAHWWESNAIHLLSRDANETF